MLNKNKVSRLVVTDNDGCPIGVISYDDFLRNKELHNAKENPLLKSTARRTRVSDLVRNELWTIDYDDDLANAVRLMSEFKINGILVVNKNKNLEGLISATYIILAYHEKKDYSILK